MRLNFFQLIDLIVVKNPPIFLNDIFLTLTGLLNTIFDKKNPSSPSHSDSYRFGHPSYDPIWTLAMSIMLIFLILVAIATTIDAYTVCFAMPDGPEESEIKNSKPEIIEKPSRPSVEPSTLSKSDINTEIALQEGLPGVKNISLEASGLKNEAYEGDSSSEEETQEEEDFGMKTRSDTLKSSELKTITPAPVVNLKETEVKSQTKPPRKPMWYTMLMFFSIRQNVVKLLDTSRPPAVIKSIDGVRAISMTWVIWGHTYFYSVNQMDNQIKVLGTFVAPWYQHIGSAVLAVDTFFVLSGFLTAFILIKKFQKNSSPGFMAKLYLHRYLRLTLIYAIIIIFNMGFLGRYGIGTMVRYIGDPSAETCRKYWWRNLLYVSNIIVSFGTTLKANLKVYLARL